MDNQTTMSSAIVITTVMDAEEVIERLNQNKVFLLSPVIVYVMFSVLVGFLGNSLVCYIYYFRLRRSPSRYFILFLAVLDLTSCVVGSGSEMMDLLQPYTFSTPWSCKILRFGLSFTIIAASFTLICVAFDRYYKVCKPLNGFPVRKVKILCVAVMILSLILSCPALVIFGMKSVDTGYPGIIGHECSTADGMRDKPYPMIYYAILFLAFIVLFTCFTLLYVRIGVELWKRKRMTIGETLPALVRQIHCKKLFRAGSIPTDDMSGPSSPSDDSKGYCENPIPMESDSHSHSHSGKIRTGSVGSPDGDIEDPLRRRSLSSSSTRRRAKLGRMSIRTVRTTGIFFAVSLAFVVSFLPYLIANVLKFGKISFYDIQSAGEEIAYNFCVRSYFISNFINPIIYSALNRNFRKECGKLFKKIFRAVTQCCRNKDSMAIM